MSKKKAFFINGGAGRVLCAIPALEYYKQNIDESVVIVAEGWHELFFASAILRENVYPVGHKNLFRDLLKDREIISPEPYRLNAYFNQQCNMIQAFDMLINGNTDDIPETKSMELSISRNDQAFGYNTVDQIKKQSGKQKAVVFQPLGSGAKLNGEFLIDESGRSIELNDIITMTKELSKHYSVIMMTNVQIPAQEAMGAAIPQANLLQWMGIVKASDYFLGCDSMGQHYAHALSKPATVIIGSTFPMNISYTNTKNFTIIDNGKDKGRIYNPFRITMDFDSERANEDSMVMTEKQVKDVIKTVTNKLGLTKQEPVDQKKLNYIQNAVNNLGKENAKTQAPLAVLNQQK